MRTRRFELRVRGCVLRAACCVSTTVLSGGYSRSRRTGDMCKHCSTDLPFDFGSRYGLEKHSAYSTLRSGQRVSRYHRPERRVLPQSKDGLREQLVFHGLALRFAPRADMTGFIVARVHRTSSGEIQLNQ